MFDIGSGSFGRSVDLLKRGLSVSSLRGNIIANNAANTQTPNFKRSEVNFEAQLKRAIQSEQYSPPLDGKVTSDKHMSFHVPMDYKEVKPMVRLDYLTESKANGNNVDEEVERINFLKNQMSYELMTRSINHQFNMMNIVIRN